MSPGTTSGVDRACRNKSLTHLCRFNRDKPHEEDSAVSAPEETAQCYEWLADP